MLQTLELDIKTFAHSNPDKEHIMAYDSQKFDDTEHCWNIVEKEAAAIVDAVCKHHHYLIGRQLLLCIENRILTYLM